MLAILALMGGLTILAGCDSLAARREAGWEAAYPALGQLIEVQGHKVHVLVSGQPRGTAPDVILIHGANGNLRDFTFDITGRLQGDFRVIAVDRPGQGWSDSWGEADNDPRFQADVLRRAVAQLGVSRPIVVGHSYGGAVAMAWAIEDPDDTGAVVLLAGATHPWGDRMTPWYRFNISPAAARVRTGLAAVMPESIAVPIIANMFAPNDVPRGYIEHIGAGLSMRRASQAENARQVNALSGFLAQMQPQYAALHLPIEIIHGDADWLLPLDIHARPLLREVPGTRLTIVAGAGHMVHHVVPDTVAAVIRRAARRAGYTLVSR